MDSRAKAPRALSSSVWILLLPRDGQKGLEMAPLKVLISGATGVVGRRLVPILVSGGHQVTAIARAHGKREEFARMGAAAIVADLLDARSLIKAVRGFDVVVNLATHMPSSMAQTIKRSAWKENDLLRSQGSANLVDAALAGGVGRFIQESFAPVYPDCGERWIEEDIPIQPVKYNETIADAERSAVRFTAGGGTGVVLRYAGFYGPDSRFLLESIPLVRNGREFLPGSPDGYVSSVSHDDAATATAAALTVPAGVYNVVDDEPVTHREYFATLAQALGVPPPKPLPRWTRWFMGSIGELLSRSQRISNRKLKSASRWTPRYPSVREGWPEVVAALPQENGFAAA